MCFNIRIYVKEHLFKDYKFHIPDYKFVICNM
jgi:hypothetical protein